MIALGVKTGLRFSYHAPTHDLLREIKARLEALDPTIKVAVWYGESAELPDGGHACPRHKERAIVRANGGDAAMLCGSRKRGFCKFNEERNGGTAACRYRAQRKDAAAAAVVLFAGGSALADMPPEWTVRKLPAHSALIDPRTGKKVAPEILVPRDEPPPVRDRRHRQVVAEAGAELEATPFEPGDAGGDARERPRRPLRPSDLQPPFDLSVIDEPVFLNRNPRAERSAHDHRDGQPGCTRNLIPDQDLPSTAREGRSGGPTQQGAPANARAGHAEGRKRPANSTPHTAKASEPEDEASERARQADMLLRFARPLVGGAAGYVTYGAVREALAGEGLATFYGPYAKAKALEDLAWGLIVRPEVNPEEDQITALEELGKREVEWAIARRYGTPPRP